ncbi:hypothetical protein KGF54_002157 [Candida jiufengensis]|uniref:uncharacterized protein n=1 Tax=Candida jiufengensis TaxID=497108 RepID=UPI002224E07B|nr:uncharacterized protein KGF54_002157 [Candida jiufengensis]KAI5954382.1 hypothetical protein KGF54_002157 [Candida jiufengensis]
MDVPEINGKSLPNSNNDNINSNINHNQSIKVDNNISSNTPSLININNTNGINILNTDSPSCNNYNNNNNCCNNKSEFQSIKSSIPKLTLPSFQQLTSSQNSSIKSILDGSTSNSNTPPISLTSSNSSSNLTNQPSPQLQSQFSNHHQYQQQSISNYQRNLPSSYQSQHSSSLSGPSSHQHLNENEKIPHNKVSEESSNSNSKVNTNSPNTPLSNLIPSPTSSSTPTLQHGNKQRLPRKYFCKTCNQGFTRKHNMVSHELIHSSLKPHVCNICNLKFRRIHDLKRHEKLHTGEKPFSCDKCSRRFARPDALTRHQNSANACSGFNNNNNNNNNNYNDQPHNRVTLSFDSGDDRASTPQRPALKVNQNSNGSGKSNNSSSSIMTESGSSQFSSNGYQESSSGGSNHSVGIPTLKTIGLTPNDLKNKDGHSSQDHNPNLPNVEENDHYSRSSSIIHQQPPQAPHPSQHWQLSVKNSYQNQHPTPLPPPNSSQVQQNPTTIPPLHSIHPIPFNPFTQLSFSGNHNQNQNQNQSTALPPLLSAFPTASLYNSQINHSSAGLNSTVSQPKPADVAYQDTNRELQHPNQQILIKQEQNGMNSGKENEKISTSLRSITATENPQILNATGKPIQINSILSDKNQQQQPQQQQSQQQQFPFPSHPNLQTRPNLHLSHDLREDNEVNSK